MIEKIKRIVKENALKLKKGHKKKKPDEYLKYLPTSNAARLTQKYEEEVEFEEQEDADFERLRKFIDELAAKQENLKKSS
ncbi:hypothetical protein LCGC14_1366730 [marine sediment metagenome]|uniref:Uncharacterized protein n=1 Tax=marine sediment metagenome TaxID=412755 RepID=A0A0F9K6L3_9ZZZZ